jgi:hypothetical protein
MPASAASPERGKDRARRTGTQRRNDTGTAVFVERVTKQGSPDFVPAVERIATFDNDGTLWTELPMLELLAYLRANGFKTIIVSGGGIDFMRVFAERSMAFRPSRSWAAAAS